MRLTIIAKYGLKTRPALKFSLQSYVFFNVLCNFVGNKSSGLCYYQ